MAAVASGRSPVADVKHRKGQRRGSVESLYGTGLRKAVRAGSAATGGDCGGAHPVIHRAIRRGTRDRREMERSRCGKTRSTQGRWLSAKHTGISDWRSSTVQHSNFPKHCTITRTTYYHYVVTTAVRRASRTKDWQCNGSSSNNFPLLPVVLLSCFVSYL